MSLDGDVPSPRPRRLPSLDGGFTMSLLVEAFPSPPRQVNGGGAEGRAPVDLGVSPTDMNMVKVDTISPPPTLHGAQVSPASSRVDGSSRRSRESTGTKTSPSKAASGHSSPNKLMRMISKDTTEERGKGGGWLGRRLSLKRNEGGVDGKRKGGFAEKLKAMRPREYLDACSHLGC